MTKSSELISADDLRSRIGDQDIAILDCRFDLSDPCAGRQAYRESHIPGAVFADLDEDLAAPPRHGKGRHPLPDINTLAATLGRLGIDNATDVIVYDANSGALAARAWWLLRWLGHEQVRLLDGGFNHWVSESNEVVAGDELVDEKLFSPNPRPDVVLSTAELAGNFDAIAGMRLIDARDAARFRGEVEPIDPVAGHIPGAQNVPFQRSLKDDGRWKARTDLAALWLSVLGEQKEVSWAVMCGSGVTACHLAISAMEAGYIEPRLYVGSWSEWILDSERPVGLGEAANPPSGPADMA